MDNNTIEDPAEFVDPSNLILMDQRQAQARAMQSLDANPDDAARAIELGEHTGVPPELIHGNLENFETQHKAKLTSQLLNNNAYLRDFADSNPMAAPVANDDWGQLDKVSEKLRDFSLPGFMFNRLKEALPDIVDVAKEGFRIIAENPADTELGAATEAEAQKLGASPEAAAQTRRTVEERTKRANVELMTGPMQVAMSPLLGLFRHHIAKPIEALTGFPAEATEGYTMALGAVLGLKAHPESAAQLHETAKAIEPYLKAGVEPPLGVDPLVDQFKIKESEGHLAVLDEAFKESQASSTRERAPDLYADFVRSHTDAKIGVSADAVRRIYGDEVPSPDDGKLGFVEGLSEQFRAAEAVGGDVQIPLADWLAKVEPDIAKELQEDIRVRPGGVTKGEAKQIKAMVEAYHGSPHDFEAFSMEKIGTGEGAQSYGHGLYFAENPEVAKSYAVGRQTGKSVSLGSFAGQEVTGMDVKPPSEYRVRIHADKEQFLDWDKPLGEQSQVVKDIVDRINPMVKFSSNPDFQLHQILRSPAGAAALREAGIPGIKYLDQGSRGGPKKVIDGVTYVQPGVRETHNFVLFDSSLIEITHKNGEAVRAVRTAAGLKPLWGERKLTLQRADDAERRPEFGAELAGRVFHPDSKSTPFDIVDVKGKAVGNLFVAEENGGKRLYIDDIEGLDRANAANSIGPSQMRDLLRQLKAEFPNAEELTGFRVSGARDKAGTWESHGKVSIKLSADIESEVAKLYSEHSEGLWADVSDDYQHIPKDDGLSQKEKVLVDEIDKEIAKLNLNDVDIELSEAIRHKETKSEVGGLHLTYDGFRPTIMLALEPDAVGVLRHEAIHELRRFLRPEEWNTLTRAARDKDWIAKHQIEAKYESQKLDMPAKLEEAVAEEFRNWKANPETNTPLGKAFAKIKQILDAVVRAVKQVFGKDLTAEEIFQEIESGKVGGREPVGEGEGAKAAPKQPELPQAGTTRMEDREPFAGSFPDWMTMDMRRRYMKLIEERNAEDIAALEKKAASETAKRQSAEWKANEKVVRDEVSSDVEARPDIAAMRMFDSGTLFGDKLEAKPKLATDSIGPEQAEALPKGWVSDRGGSPDDLAGLFGYKSGREMIDALIRTNQERTQAGMSVNAYTERMIDIATEKAMSERYGTSAEEALAEAKDHVASQTQMDLLHEEVLALGLKHNLEFSLTRDQIRKVVDGEISKTLQADISSDAFLAAAGRAGRKAEEALLKNEYLDAFRAKQQQYLAMLSAREASAIEKEKAAFDKLAKRYRKKEVAGTNQEFTDFIQDLLADAEAGKRIGSETAETRHGYTSFDEFVGSKIGDGWELDVSDPIRAGQFRPLANMTVDEFRDFKAAIDSLHRVGRDVNKITIAGQKVEFADFKAEVLENIRQLPVRDPTKKANWFYSFDAALTRTEELMKDLDLRQEHGPLFSAVIRPMAESKHTEYSMIEDLSKRLKAIRGEFGKDWRRSLDDTIPQDFFHDPYYHEPVLFDLSRQNMINIMLNFGNRSSIEKFTKGYAGKEKMAEFEGKLRQLFDEHATKEDWQYVQNLWDVFKDWQPESQKLYYDLGGGRKKWIEPEKVATPHGEFDGGYWPLLKDFKRSIGTASVSADAMFGPNYYKASPTNHYTKERSGSVYRVNFLGTLEEIGSRMQQQIHDISYRRAVMDVAKIISDGDIMNAVRKHYGEEYAKQLRPWLKDIANHFDQEEEAIGAVNSFMRRMRMNLMGSALGLNLRVILSPDLGQLNPMAVARYNAYPNAEGYVMGLSKELPHTFRNMDRDFRERLELTMSQKGWTGLQADATRATLWPVAMVSQQFRKVTFFDEFQKAKARGMDDGAAGAWADSLVRERHGSGGLPDIPAIMRSNEFMKSSTLFYGYFNTMYNWQRQMVTQARSGEYQKMLATFYGSVAIGSAFGALLFNQQKEGDGWFKIIGKAVTLQPLSTVPFVRDAANYFMEGNTARSPFASLLQYAGAAYTDAKNVYMHKPIKKPISHAANVVGLYPGVPGTAQLGRTTQFLSDVAQNKQRPRNIIEWTRGIIGGEARLHK